MPTLTIDKEALIKGLNQQFDADLFTYQLSELKKLKDKGFNPFAPNADGKVSWEVIKAGNTVLHDLFFTGIAAVEKNAYDLGEVAKGAKLDALVEFLDKIIKLPFYLEFVDGPAIRLMIVGIVGSLDKVLGKDWYNKIPKPEVNP